VAAHEPSSAGPELAASELAASELAASELAALRTGILDTREERAIVVRPLRVLRLALIEAALKERRIVAHTRTEAVVEGDAVGVIDAHRKNACARLPIFIDTSLTASAARLVIAR
jgi:hypothetical protein